jgi:hypothetical protein
MDLLTLDRRVELGQIPQHDASAVLIRIAENVIEWHGQGILHRELSPWSIRLSATLDEIEVREAVTCGGADWDHDRYPAELCSLHALDIPRDLSDARRVFTAARIPLDPTQLDIYLLGTLFCRMLTSESTAAYISSPRTRSHVPSEWRQLLDRSLGAVRRERWGSVVDLVEALRG